MHFRTISPYFTWFYTILEHKYMVHKHLRDTIAKLLSFNEL
jgi:hypothetical protein